MRLVIICLLFGAIVPVCWGQTATGDSAQRETGSVRTEPAPEPAPAPEPTPAPADETDDDDPAKAESERSKLEKEKYQTERKLAIAEVNAELAEVQAELDEMDEEDGEDDPGSLSFLKSRIEILRKKKDWLKANATLEDEILAAQEAGKKKLARKLKKQLKRVEDEQELSLVEHELEANREAVKELEARAESLRKALSK